MSLSYTIKINGQMQARAFNPRIAAVAAIAIAIATGKTVTIHWRCAWIVAVESSNADQLTAEVRSLRVIAENMQDELEAFKRENAK